MHAFACEAGPSRQTLKTVKKSLRPALVVPLAALALAAPATAVTATAAHAGTTIAPRLASKPSSNHIDTSSRSAVAQAWKSRWVPTTGQSISLSGGSANSCKVFTASSATQSAALTAINFARGLDGLDSISSVTDKHLADAEHSALIQAANDTLTHTPSSNLSCYTKSGATGAASSDLGYLSDSRPGWVPTVSAFLHNYMDDAGSVNEVVAHRRWILRPEAGTMANAYARALGGAGTVFTNDLWIFPSSSDRKNATKPTFYAWPATGYFPTSLEPNGRWSLSASSSKISFAHATVAVSYQGKSVSVHRYTPATGYADNTIVWQFASAPAGVTSGEHDYKVTVSHITGHGAYSYWVKLFKP